MKNKNNLIIGIGIYIASALLSYILFANVVFSGISGLVETPIPEPEVGEDGRVVFDDTLPKTEPCPLSGEKFSKQQKKWWETHRPLGVMIENHQEARPQSGLSHADVVYEAVAEGGISRFLSVFYCQDPGIVGPVRSARTYFLDFISEYGDYPLYAHVGGANTPGPADALGQIVKYGWQSYNDMNQFSIGFPTFYRDYDRLGRTVATEHTMYGKATGLWDLGAERGLTNVDEDGVSWNEDFVEYTFEDDPDISKRGVSQEISLELWPGKSDYSIQYSYDQTTNRYLRNSGGVKHEDLNTKTQLFAKNIVILYMKESNANDGYENNLHLVYGTTGSGKAVVFKNGEQIDAKWSKKNRTSRTIITDKSGEEIVFTRGLLWFVVVPLGNDTLAVN